MGVSPLSPEIPGLCERRKHSAGEGLGFETGRFGSHLISSTQQLDRPLNIRPPFSHL